MYAFRQLKLALWITYRWMDVTYKQRINYYTPGILAFSILTISLFFSCEIPVNKEEDQTDPSTSTDTVVSVIQTNLESSSEWDTTGWNDTTWLQEKDKISADSLARLHQRYAIIKSKIKQQRNLFRDQYNQASSDSAQKAILQKAGSYLNQQLAEEVFPAWYGTTWDFNGYTNKPNDGLIACGYFVSTPLRHVGVNLNRYRVAQQYSTAIVEILCTDQKTFFDLEKMLAYVKNRPDDLYIVGLDNHVGFIRKSGNKVRFIHSSYLTPIAVVNEAAKTSEALGYSTVFVMGSLTSNEDFIRKWLISEEIKVKG